MTNDMTAEERVITLTKGYEAIVDPEDYEYLNKFKWHVNKNRNTFYARRKEDNGFIYMHREILGLKKHDGKQGDHINGNGLDNRRRNLRVCSNQQNSFNQKPTKGRSKYKGVYRHKDNKSWVSQVKVNNKVIHIGSFKTENEAGIAYNAKAIECFGEYARLNVIQ